MDVNKSFEFFSAQPQLKTLFLDLLKKMLVFEEIFVKKMFAANALACANKIERNLHRN